SRDCNHVSAQSRRNVDCSKADTAAPEDGYPLARIYLSLIHDAVPGRHETTPHRSSFEIRNRRGQMYQVDIGTRHFGVAAKSPGVVEHRHAEIETNVLMAGLALFTSAATMVERNRDTIALFELRYIGSNLLHDTAELMTEDDRRLGGDTEPGPASLPKVM